MNDENETTADTTAATGPESGPGTPEPSRRSRWRAAARERVAWTRRVAALAVAGALLVGGAGGFAVGALATDGRPDPGDWGHHGRFDDDRQMPPPGVPGQLPPMTRDDDSGLTG